VGGEKSPRDAVGATIYVTAGGVRQRGDVFSGASYASTSDMRPHFGLGAVSTVDKVEVHWPSGRTEVFPADGVDEIILLKEGKGVQVSSAVAAIR